jgi:hypothetical protein
MSVVKFRSRHCEAQRAVAIHYAPTGLLRHCAPRNDEVKEFVWAF